MREYQLCGRHAIGIVLHEKLLEEILAVIKGIFLLAGKQPFLHGKYHQEDRIVCYRIGDDILVRLLRALNMLAFGKVFDRTNLVAEEKCPLVILGSRVSRHLRSQ